MSAMRSHVQREFRSVTPETGTSPLCSLPHSCAPVPPGAHDRSSIRPPRCCGLQILSLMPSSKLVTPRPHKSSGLQASPVSSGICRRKRDGVPLTLPQHAMCGEGNVTMFTTKQVITPLPPGRQHQLHLPLGEHTARTPAQIWHPCVDTRPQHQSPKRTHRRRRSS